MIKKEYLEDLKMMRSKLDELKIRNKFPISMQHPLGGPPTVMTYEDSRAMLEDMACMTDESMPKEAQLAAAKRLGFYNE